MILLAKKKTPKKKCQECQKEYVLTNFYKTNYPFSKDGKAEVCKKCIKKIIDYDNFDTIYKVLQIMDIPFIDDVWDKSNDANGDKFGNYMRMINSLPQYKDLRYESSQFPVKKENEPQRGSMAEQIAKIPLGDLVDKWGDYDAKELRAFEKKYQELIKNYPTKTSFHKEHLLTYVRFRVKEEIATAKGDLADAKQWSSMASSSAQDAKIKPSQLSKADLTDGLTSFSELSMAVEKVQDIIRILPRFKARPNDALDFNIWCYVNYIRDMKGLEPCEYSEIYEFYDKMVEEYIEQYGDPYDIFIEDNSIKNRAKIQKFITKKPKVEDDDESEDIQDKEIDGEDGGDE